MDVIVLILIVAGTVLFSAVCSGLNISLMSLDAGDLRRKTKLGNRAAIRLLPLRAQTHVTLSSILLANVAAVSATAIVLGDYLNGFVAGIISTFLNVILAEILPQAIFAKDPLKWTNRFYYLLLAMRTVLYPVAKPLAKLLDLVVGKSQRKLLSRRELGVLITEHLGAPASELDDDEVEIVASTLQLSEKMMQDIMTPIARTYWLKPDTALTSKRVGEMKDKGYSRVPVFNESLTGCEGVILMKDLVDIDFNEHAYHARDFALHPVKFSGPRTALDTSFRKFIGSHSHMMPIKTGGRIIGITTIEDLIEEIIGHEILDETDRRKNRG